jgi:hypothetical protein
MVFAIVGVTDCSNITTFLCMSTQPLAIIIIIITSHSVCGAQVVIIARRLIFVLAATVVNGDLAFNISAPTLEEVVYFPFTLYVNSKIANEQKL